MGFQEENAETIPSETPCKPIVYVIVQFLNWLNFISKLVQYFKVVHFFLKQFNFLNWFIFFWRTVFFLTGTLKKKGLSSTFLFLLYHLFSIPSLSVSLPYPHYLYYLNISFTQRQITFTSTRFQPLPQPKCLNVFSEPQSTEPR